MIVFHRLRRGLVLGAISAALSAAFPGLAAAQQGPGVTDKDIKIGSWITLTGPIAAYGIPQREGFEAYIKMINDRGGVKGRKFEYVVEDNAYNPQRTVTAARKLVDRDQVLAIVHPLGTAQSLAAFDYVLGEAKVPILLPQAGLVDWWRPVRENLYGVLVYYEAHGRAVGRWAAKDNHKNIVVVHTALSAFESVAKEVVVGHKSVRQDGTLDLYPVKFATADYGPIVLDILRKKPDGVIGILPQGETIALAKELRQQGSKIELYSYGPASTNSLIDTGGAAVEGLKALAHVVPPNSETPSVREYREALAKYSPNEKPDYGSLFSWANAKIFVEAVRRIDGPINRANLVKAMETLKNYETGILPPVTFSPQQHLGTLGLQRVEVKGGKWQAVGGFIDAESNW